MVRIKRFVRVCQECGTWFQPYPHSLDERWSVCEACRNVSTRVKL